jgi:hypothetical protein
MEGMNRRGDRQIDEAGTPEPSYEGHSSIKLKPAEVIDKAAARRNRIGTSDLEQPGLTHHEPDMASGGMYVGPSHSIFRPPHPHHPMLGDPMTLPLPDSVLPPYAPLSYRHS